ncbi:MAG TPA: hypothetical protein VGG75_15925 [Trebonia sp.]
MINTAATAVTNANLLKKIKRLEATIAAMQEIPSEPGPSTADAWIRYAARQAERADAERVALGLDAPRYRRPQAEGNTARTAQAEGNTADSDPMQARRSADPQGNVPREAGPMDDGHRRRFPPSGYA